jgi:hypothetical protein
MGGNDSGDRAVAAIGKERDLSAASNLIGARLSPGWSCVALFISALGLVLTPMGLTQPSIGASSRQSHPCHQSNVCITSTRQVPRLGLKDRRFLVRSTCFRTRRTD